MNGLKKLAEFPRGGRTTTGSVSKIMCRWKTKSPASPRWSIAVISSSMRSCTCSSYVDRALDSEDIERLISALDDALDKIEATAVRM